MSPGYEARAAIALKMLKLVHGKDLISDAAKIDYRLCHELLLKYGQKQAMQEYLQRHGLTTDVEDKP